MARVRNLRGRRFRRLRVLAFDRIRHRHAYWRCRCDCGASTVVRGAKLTAGRIVSCGCWRADPAVRRAARIKVPAARRQKIAQSGARARWRP